MAYENIEVEIEGHVAIVRLNRPKALNALCAALVWSAKTDGDATVVHVDNRFA